MEALTKGEAVRRYARRWPITYAWMTSLSVLGAEALIEPLLKSWHVGYDASYGERVGLALFVGVVLTAVTRNARPQESPPVV